MGRAGCFHHPQTVLHVLDAIKFGRCQAESIDQTFDDAQVKHLGIAQDVPNAENRHIRLVGQPVKLSRTPSKMAAPPPEFGEQTDEVLAEFGLSVSEIEELRKAKVV